MKSDLSPRSRAAYRDAGVDTDEADIGLRRLVKRITGTWLSAGRFGGVELPIGYFANVINIGGMGLAICTDGVGSKAIIAELMKRYDTIGIDCVAMNANDLICVGARPLSFVDYIAVEGVDADILDSIAIGLAEGAKQAGVSICGGEIAQLEDIVRGFDLAGTAVGTVPLDKIITGRDLEPGDRIVGIGSSGIHSNGLSLARKAFFKGERPLPLDYPIPQTGVPLGEELLRPTLIYVSEIMEILENVGDVKALIHITGDGLLNLSRVDAARVGFRIDEMPPTPAIFQLIQEYGEVATAEMFEVYNMGVGFCVIVSPASVSAVLSILERHSQKAWVIGEVIEEPGKAVVIEATRPRLVGHGKRFRGE
jgi:phosphoribosylformylglycinamidine cyclo-ligase